MSEIIREDIDEFFGLDDDSEDEHGHADHVDCMFCTICGQCSESLDEDNVCADCRGGE